MSSRLQEKIRQRLAGERGPRPPAWGGRLSVALVYPNTYHQAMSNLGFLSVHHELNRRPETLCERVVLPDPEELAEHRRTGTPLLSLESGRPLDAFDLVAFSISFENDYLHLPLLFELARLPLWAKERDRRHPLILCGGVCAFLNPEPLAGIMDLFAVGEGEVLLPDLIAALTAGGERDQILARLAATPGFYVPALYQVSYREDGCIAACRPLPPAPERVRRRWLADLDRAPLPEVVESPETEFGDMRLLEVSRGCGRGCRFCAAGFVFLPPRRRTRARLEAALCQGVRERGKVGLVGTAVADHPELGELQDLVLAVGGSASLSSLRLDALDAAGAARLAASGLRTATLAPEAGSQRLRDRINKNLDETQILHAVKLLAAAGIPNLKLYFLIGLPGETDTDLDELLALVTRVRATWLAAGKARGQLGSLHLSVNPFVPKPFTPFQWAAMAPEPLLRARLQRLRGAVARLPNTTLHAESLRAAVLQAFLARGDRRAGALLPLLAAGHNLKAAARAAGLSWEFYVTRERGADERFPWEVIDSGVARAHLRTEYERALAGRTSPPCGPGCSRCGLCV